MNPYETFGSPDADRPSSRYGRDEDLPPRNDSYRRRSPAAGGRRGGRNRSRSPVPIDRYQPSDRDRERRDDYYDGARQHSQRDREERRRAPSPTAANIDRYVPGQDSGKPTITRNPLPNPNTLEMQVGFTWFAEWWRMEQQIKEEKERSKHGGRRPLDRVKGEKEAREDREKERTQIQTAYDQYKLELQAKMARTFVQQHKDEEWFKEKYVPEVRNPIRQRLRDFRRESFEQWMGDLENGSFDDFTLEGIYKQDHDGAGGTVEKEEGEATGGGEMMGVLDLVPAKGGQLRDSSLDQPALLIKTLAPNVSRDKVEAFCKEHLGEEEGGFRWLSLSDPNPAKKCHRIGWIMLRPGGDADPMEDVQRGDGRDEEGEEEGKDLENGEKKTKTTSERALDLVNEKVISDPVKGDFTCHVGLHNPTNTLRKKALWDLFSAPERVERDLELAKRLVQKFENEDGFTSETGGLNVIETRVDEMRARGLLQPANPSPVKAKKNAFADNEDMIKFEDDIEEGEDDEDETDDEDLIYKKKLLDILVEYLRRVFNFCFFCVFESDSVHELVRKCPGGHLRRPRAALNSHAKAAARASALNEPFPIKKKSDFLEEGEEISSPVEERNSRGKSKADQQLLRAFNWVKTYEDKILQILEPEYADLKKLGGRPVDEAIEDELKKYVKQEDEAKYRCKVPECTKLFKAEHFWRKHVEKRHEEWFNALRNDLNLVNSYVLDPAHIAPSRSDANSNGHFPIPQNQQMQTGTPRHFNLNTMMSNANVMPGANLIGMQGFQAPFIAANANQASFMTNAMQAGTNGGMSMHNPGAVRRGGNRFNNRSGPYDRRGNNPRAYNNRNPSSSGFGGGDMRGGAMMGMGYLAQGGGGGGGKWGDGAGGIMSVPREAVQGRSIKSYEDLDAQPASAAAASSADAAGAGGAELDY
ncbi:MAG: hypothetical protein Q9227_008864 [Pyrenula ochraceoflavens]